MRKSYDTLADYDEDYRFSWAPVNEPLPPATVEFLGERHFRVTPMWSRPLVGGHITFTGTPGFTLGVGQCAPVGTPHPSRIESIEGSVVTLEAGHFPLGAVEIGQGHARAAYHVPRMMLPGTNPAIMRRVWAPVCEGVVRTLEGLSINPLMPEHKVAIIGCGFGYEVECWHALGYNVVGVDTSALVHREKTVDYTPEYRKQLLAVGLDPDVGEGASILAGWLQKSRTEAMILNADISNGRGRKAVRDALGGPVDWAISSFVLAVLDDTEALDMNAAMISLASNTAHYTNVASGPGGTRGENQMEIFNWKSLMGWKVLLSPSLIVGEAPRFEIV